MSTADLMNDTLLEEVPRKDGRIVLGPCYLIRKLGQGAMGAVYEGHHIALDSRVAVKVLPDYLAAKDPKFIERFYREARTAFKVRHPGVVSVLDVGQDETSKVYYLVMEYVEGESAGDLLKRLKKINEATALDIAIGVADALEAALQVKVIHRDIKPDNIMIAKDGKVKLADMGLAKQQSAADEDGAAAGMTMANVAMGTPYYMSPEAAQDAKNVDHRADIYSLGVSLFEMVTGDVPYRDKTTFAIMMKHVQAPLPNPKETNPQLSDELCRILSKMLEKRTTARYQTPTELLKDLRALRAQYRPEAGLQSLYGPHAGDGSVIVEDGCQTLAISHADQQRILTARSNSSLAANAQTTAGQKDTQAANVVAPVPPPTPRDKPAAQGQPVTSANAMTPEKPALASTQPSSNVGMIVGLVLAGLFLVLLLLGAGVWYLIHSAESKPTTTADAGDHPATPDHVNVTNANSNGGADSPTPPTTTPTTTPNITPLPVNTGAPAADPAIETRKLARQNALLADVRNALDHWDLDTAKERLDAADRIALTAPNPDLKAVHDRYAAADASAQTAKNQLALAERNYTDKNYTAAYSNSKAALAGLPVLFDAEAVMGLSAKQQGRTPEAEFQLNDYLKKAVPEANYSYVADARAALADIAAAADRAGVAKQKADALAFIDQLAKQDKFSAAQEALAQQSKLFPPMELQAHKADIESQRSAREKTVAADIRAQIGRQEFPAAEAAIQANAGVFLPAESAGLAKELADARTAQQERLAAANAAKQRGANLARLRQQVEGRIQGKDYSGARSALAAFSQAGAPEGEVAAFTQRVEALKPHAASFTCKTIGMEMLYIPPATFEMGTNGGDRDEGPPKKVTLTHGFYMAKTELTYAMYKQFLDDNPDHQRPSEEKRRILKPDGPIVGISFNDAVDFCAWLSQKEGRTYTLPTEAQWEYAARGTDGRRFPWGSKLPRDQAEIAEYLKCQGAKPHGLQPVGSYPKGASPFGILDMAGNAAEWCRDAYASNLYTSPDIPSTDPLVVGIKGQNGVNDKARVVRGGDFTADLRDCRTTKRDFQTTEDNEGNITIRLVTKADD